MELGFAHKNSNPNSLDFDNSFNSFAKYAPGPEILAKMSQNMQVWFGDLDFGTF